MSALTITWLALILLGWLAWTLVEHAGHRWIMHGHLPPGFLRDEHRAHHRDPTDLPTWRSLVHAVPGLIILSVGSLAIRRAVGIDVRPVAVGLAFGGAGCVVAHRLAHTTEGRPRWVPLPWRCHLGHHAVSSRSNFGFSTVLWDRAFGTFEAPRGQDSPRRGASPAATRGQRRTAS